MTFIHICLGLSQGLWFGYDWRCWAAAQLRDSSQTYFIVQSAEIKASGHTPKMGRCNRFYEGLMTTLPGKAAWINSELLFFVHMHLKYQKRGMGLLRRAQIGHLLLVTLCCGDKDEQKPVDLPEELWIWPGSTSACISVPLSKEWNLSLFTFKQPRPRPMSVMYPDCFRIAAVKWWPAILKIAVTCAFQHNLCSKQ